MRIVRRQHLNCSVASPKKKKEKKRKLKECYIIVRRCDNYINIRLLKRKRDGYWRDLSSIKKNVRQRVA